MHRTRSIQHCLRACITAVVATVAVVGRSAAQDSAVVRDTTRLAPYRARVLGVFDAATGAPVADADVIDVLSGASARTTRTGTVALSFLPDGGGLVRIRKVGYEMQTMVVAISPADTVPITVVLQPAVLLPGVTTYAAPHYISPNLRGFEERSQKGFGYYIHDDQLRKEEYRPLGNVLASHVPGINIKRGRGSRMLLEKSPRCMVGGPPDVYIDGVPWPHPLPPPRRHDTSADPSSQANQPIDLSEFNVSDLAGVEYYPDQDIAPMEYSGTSAGCGVLLLWTREK